MIAVFLVLVICLSRWIECNVITTASIQGLNGVELPLHNKFLVLQCNSTSGRQVDHWLRNGIEIRGSDDFNYNRNNNSLMMYNTKKSVHEGNYTCVFSSPSKDEGHILVRAKPEVTLESELYVSGTSSINIIEGDNLRLVCKLKSNDSFSNSNLVFSWQVQPEDESVEPVEAKENNIANLYLENEGNDGQPASTLTISPIGYTHRAFYTCQVSNEIGTGKIRVLIRVKDRLAALWPFLLILAEVIILCTVIFVYEKRRQKPGDLEDEDDLNTG